MLLSGVIYMNLALIFYTYAVFSGRKEGLHLKHLIVFGIGLFSDFLGTRQMNAYATLNGPAPEWHNIFGVTSLAGMGLHFLLALAATLMNRADSINRTFHKVSLTIYTLWCIAFISGSIAGMLSLNSSH